MNFWDIWFIGIIVSLAIHVVRAGMISERFTGCDGGDRFLIYIAGSFCISLIWPAAIPGFLLYQLGKKIKK